MSDFDDGAPPRWRRVYLVAAAAGAVLGTLVAFGVVPYVPDRLTAWIRTERIMVPVVILAGTLFGLLLASVAHLGVRWQLRDNKPEPPP